MIFTHRKEQPMATYGVDPRNLVDTGGELRQATMAIQGVLDALDSAVNSYHGDNTGQHGLLYDNGSYSTLDNPLSGNAVEQNAHSADMRPIIQCVRPQPGQ